MNTNSIIERIKYDKERQELCNPDFGWTKQIDAEIAPNGWENKLNFVMILQILLSVYYAVSYALEFTRFNNYYIWPQEEDGKNTYYIFRTDTNHFSCEGYDLYRADQGPGGDINSQTSVASSTWEWVFILICWLLVIASFMLFCFIRLYRGQYNQLLGFITFESKHHSPPLVAKFSVAYTVFCNLSKGAGNILMSEKCGKLGFGVLLPGYFTIDLVEAIGTIIYGISFAAFFLWIQMWGYCYLYKHNDSLLTGKFTFWLVRAILLVTILSYYFLIIVKFNPTVNFDLNYPNWIAVSVISAFDLGFSTIADAYFLFISSCEDGTCTETCSSDGFDNSMDSSDPPELHNSSRKTLESRLEEGIEGLEPVANSGEKYIKNEEKQRRRALREYEKEVASQALLALQEGNVHLWDPPYYVNGIRDDDAIESLANTIAYSPDTKNEVIIALRKFQASSLKFFAESQNDYNIGNECM